MRFLLLAIIMLLNGCQPHLVGSNFQKGGVSRRNSYRIAGHTYDVMRVGSRYKSRGIASWYGSKFHRQRTSSGERYNMYGMTAAHKTLPLSTYVRVKNLDNGRVATVRINDRGPFRSNRIIDLSYAAAKQLGVKGTAHVEVEALRGKR